MSWLALMLYMLSMPKVLGAVVVIAAVSFNAFFFSAANFEANLKCGLLQEQKLKEGVLNKIRWLGTISFLLSLLILAGLITKAARESFSANAVAIILFLALALTHVLMLPYIKSITKNIDPDSKPFM